MKFFLFYVALLFILCYHILRKLYYSIVRLFFIHMFDADVTFEPGYSFLSLKNIKISFDNREITVLLLHPSFGIHSHFQVHGVFFKNITIDDVKKAIKTTLKSFERNIPSNHFFHLTINIDEINYENQNTKFHVLDYQSIHTGSLFSVKCSKANYSDLNLECEIHEYEHQIHFHGSFPERIQILRPILNLSCRNNHFIVGETEFVGFSQIKSIWRLFSRFSSLSVRINNLQKGFYLDNTNISLVFPEFLNIYFKKDLKFTFETFNCLSDNHEFSIDVTKGIITQRIFNFESCKVRFEYRFLGLIFERNKFHYSNIIFNTFQITIVDNKSQMNSIRISISQLSENKNLTKADNFTIDLLSKDNSIANFTSTKCQFIGQSSLVCEECNLTFFSNQEQIKRSYLSIVSEIDESFTNNKYNIQASSSIFDQKIEGLCFKIIDLQFDICLKPLIYNEQAKKFVNTTFPKCDRIRNVRFISPIKFKFTCSSMVSNSSTFVDCKFRGQFGTIFGQMSFNLYFIIYSKIKTCYIVLDSFVDQQLVLLSFNIEDLELIVNNHKYSLSNTRGDNNEASFDKINMVRFEKPKQLLKPPSDSVNPYRNTKLDKLNNKKRNRRAAHFEFTEDAMKSTESFSLTNSDIMFALASSPQKMPNDKRLNFVINGSNGEISLLKQEISVETLTFNDINFFNAIIKLSSFEPSKIFAENFEVFGSSGLDLKYHIDDGKIIAKSFTISNNQTSIHTLTSYFNTAEIEEVRFDDLLMHYTNIDSKTMKITAKYASISTRKFKAELTEMKLIPKNDLWGMIADSALLYISTKYNFQLYSQWELPNLVSNVVIEGVHAMIYRKRNKVTHELNLGNFYSQKSVDSNNKYKNTLSASMCELYDISKNRIKIISVKYDSNKPVFRLLTSYKDGIFERIYLGLNEVIFTANSDITSKLMHTVEPMISYNDKLIKNKYPVCTFSETDIEIGKLKVEYFDKTKESPYDDMKLETQVTLMINEQKYTAPNLAKRIIDEINNYVHKQFSPLVNNPDYDASKMKKH
ncbi:hypothetical protein TRFO_30325 [Tritrichomonas foetus]|uniref:Uncharacterized protein n=1 Tax=Tritrichomonas foetus TaxID=1144522 RepID=A0A1J4JYC8_9EUKA|nr:hypothetical protein TRFO_30325 [Tritrichomonas foetus]|eukprot:OHT02532.1 hypothetical protein TRFO_30325 [Tritrichomonas foetus]